MRQLSDFCRVVENALPDQICDAIIDFYNNNQQHHERFDNNKKPNFTQLNVTKIAGQDSGMNQFLVQTSLYWLNEYRKSVPETEYWPDKVAFEEFRIKHYNGDGNDQFDMHVDSISMSTAKRYFAFFWYLNDVTAGGETVFPPLNNMTIVPKKGQMFMFPPLWLYPHRGNPLSGGEKFLLSSYLHYVE